MSDFVWRVSLSGYKWGKLQTKEGLRDDLLISTFTGKHREYRPTIEEPSLYRKFASLLDLVELKSNPDDFRSKVIQFADQYGHLTAGVTFINVRGKEIKNELVEPLRWPNGTPYTARWFVELEEPILPPREDLELWTTNVLKISPLIQIWNQIRNNGTQLAKSKLMRSILIEIRHCVVPCYENSKILSFEPLDLLSCIWLQFAQVVGSDRQHRKCEHCQVWFEVSAKEKGKPRAKRKDRKYCSDSCKVLECYRRKALAAPVTASVDSSRESKGNESRKRGSTLKKPR